VPLAVTYSQPGDPADILDVTDIEDPPDPGRGEIQVRVSVFPIHPGDLFNVNATSPRGGQPSRAGLEATGTVERVGPGVTDVAPGDRVTIFPHLGAWAQVINVAAELAVAVPEGLSDDIAAQLLCNPVTALMLHRAAGKHFATAYNGVIINNAAASSVGRLVAAYSADHGIDTINVVRNASRAQQLSAEFSGMAAVSTDAPDWPETIRRAAAPAQITAVIDPVGGDVGSELFALLAPGGTLITYGQLSGEPIVLDPAVLMSGAGQRGLTIGRWLSASSADQRASDTAAAVALVLAHEHRLAPAAVYPLSELTKAVQHVSLPGKLGTVIVHT
jgi:NADPH:quinone reductase-like Zn-dependent oxidoreductase